MRQYCAHWKKEKWLTPEILKKQHPFDKRTEARVLLPLLIKSMYDLSRLKLSFDWKWGTDGTAALAALRNWLDLPEEVK